MMQPSQPLMSEDATRGQVATSAARCSLRESKMRAVLVVVADILREQTFQMPFVHGNNVIQQVSSAAFDPTLRHAILPRTFESGPHGVYLQGPNCYWNLQPILRISIEDQKPGSGLKRKRFPQLLDDPLGRRMPGDVEVENTSTTVAEGQRSSRARRT